MEALHCARHIHEEEERNEELLLLLWIGWVQRPSEERGRNRPSLVLQTHISFCWLKVCVCVCVCVCVSPWLSFTELCFVTTHMTLWMRVCQCLSQKPKDNEKERETRRDETREERDETREERDERDKRDQKREKRVRRERRERAQMDVAMWHLVY